MHNNANGIVFSVTMYGDLHWMFIIQQKQQKKENEEKRWVLHDHIL